MTGAVVDWLRGFWAFYRQYTNTAIHTAATASLAIFGLLVFVDPLFAVLAIAAYVVPPLVLFVRESTTARETTVIPETDEQTTTHSMESDAPHPPPVGRQRGSAGDTSSDRDGTDTDSDRDGTDTDSDRDGTDTDSDRDGTDTDSDRDGTDTDSDRDS